LCRLRAQPYFATGWFWFLGMLVPVIGLVQVGGAQIADRYSYLPSVGIFIAVTFLALDAANRWRLSKKFLGAIAVVILLANVLAMELQMHHWRSNVALFQHALEVTADNDVARNNLGVALEREGRLAEATEQYRAAAKLEPDRYQGHHNLASALDKLGRHQEALASHRAAVQLGPDVQFLHHCLALELLTLGQPDEARKEFNEAAKLDAHYPWPHLELAKMDLAVGRDAEAVEELRAAVRAEPENVDILRYTALVLAAHENPDVRDGRSAFALAAKANLLVGGTRADVLDTLGIACAELGKFDEAQLAAQQALDLAKAQKLKEIEPIQQRLALYKNHQPWRESFRTP
jgi:tetratricopeptide (TPR) repeat protein